MEKLTLYYSKSEILALFQNRVSFYPNFDSTTNKNPLSWENFMTPFYREPVAEQAVL